MKKIDISEIQKLQERYSDLVWYCRVSAENEKIKGVRDNKARIEKMYPNEVTQLHSENSNWHHGFNSGCLAGLRFALDLADGGIEYATSEFPSLDT